MRVRLPLSVGIASLWAWSRTVLGAVTFVTLGLFLNYLLHETNLELGPLVAGALAALGLILFLIFTTQNARRAWSRLPSDLLLTEHGVEVSGGPAAGQSFGWKELDAPGAKVEDAEDKRVTLSGMVGTVVLGTLALAAEKGTPAPSLDDIDPNADVGKTQLLLLTGGKSIVVAETDDPAESRSLRAARSSLTAVVEGRRTIEGQPSVAQDFLSCPSCKAPQALEDVEQLTCPYCSTTVPVSEAFRERVRETRALGESFTRAKETVALLQKQPLANSVAQQIVSAAVLMGAGFVAVVLAPTLAQKVVLTVFAFAWLGFVISAMRARLASRGALRVLSLGYGASAPERPGAPARCRRCHGPFPASKSEAGAVERCMFCRTDNVMGIDLRPAVASTRAAEESLEPLLQHFAREKRTWTTLTVLSLLATVGFAVASRFVTQ